MGSLHDVDKLLPSLVGRNSTASPASLTANFAPDPNAPELLMFFLVESLVIFTSKTPV